MEKSSTSWSVSLTSTTPARFKWRIWASSIKLWNACHSHPSGTVTGKLGQMGDIPIETEALLVDAGVTWNEFPEDVLDDLPRTVRIIPVIAVLAVFVSTY